MGTMPNLQPYLAGQQNVAMLLKSLQRESTSHPARSSFNPTELNSPHILILVRTAPGGSYRWLRKDWGGFLCKVKESQAGETSFPCSKAPSRPRERWTSPDRVLQAPQVAKRWWTSDSNCPTLPNPATQLSSQRCCEQCVLVLLSPGKKVPWWRQGGLEDTVGPSSSHEVNRYLSWQCQLLIPCGALYHPEVVFVPLMGHVPWSWSLLPVLGALLTNNFVQHVLKVLVTFTVLPNSCFFLVWHAASHSGEKIIVWLNSWSIFYPMTVSLFENWWSISYIKDHQV